MDFAHTAVRELPVSRGSSLDAVKEQVKQATDIVELVGSFIQLRRQGRHFVGLCPWHEDSRPSLTVNQDHQSFKCWVCNLGGDVFTFVMQMEGVSFPEALALLAERANIDLKPQKRTAQPGAPAAAFDKPTLLRAMAWAETQYHTCLLELPEGEPGRKYFGERSLDAENIAKFHLGFCPDQWDWIIRRAQNGGPSEKLLEAVGLLARSASVGRAFDRFKGRVMFPIRDTQGRAIGIGGRILPEAAATNPAKYVNSPETPLFHKSEQLYGLDVAKEGIRKTRQVMVMEGYTDCIMAHQFGFTDAVAVLGTALGEGHIRILKRFADRIILVLDGDEAGQKRTNEVLGLFVAQQVDLRIVTLPEEFDPCEFLLERGAAAFAELLSSRAVDALEHAYRRETHGLDLNRDVHGATQAMERLLAIVARAPRQGENTPPELRLREEMILKRMAGQFRIDERQIRQRLGELRRQARPAPTVRHSGGNQPAQPMAPQRVDPYEGELLQILLQHPELVARAEEAIAPEQLASATGRRIYETMCRLTAAGESPTFDRLMLEFEDPAVNNLLVELDERGRDKWKRVPDPENQMEVMIETFRKLDLDRRRPAQVDSLQPGQHDPAEELKLLLDVMEQVRARQGNSGPMEG